MLYFPKYARSYEFGQKSVHVDGHDHQSKERVDAKRGREDLPHFEFGLPGQVAVHESVCRHPHKIKKPGHEGSDKDEPTREGYLFYYIFELYRLSIRLHYKNLYTNEQ